MKILTAIVCFLIVNTATIAQDSSIGNRESNARNSLFVELGGTGIIYSFNYERIVSIKNNNLISLRIGIGSYKVTREYNGQTLSIPTEINYSKGKRNGHLEFGIGLSWLIINENPHNFFLGIFVPRIGYRYQKPAGGFLFRAGFTPVIGIFVHEFGEFGSGVTFGGFEPPIAPWLGLSIGYSF